MSSKRGRLHGEVGIKRPSPLSFHGGRQPSVLNLIDPDSPVFKMPSFEKFMNFVGQQIAHRDVLVHCNQGESRSQSLAMLFMAKRMGLLPNDCYESAAAAYRVKVDFRPSRGITVWLTRHWNELK